MNDKNIVLEKIDNKQDNNESLALSEFVPVQHKKTDVLSIFSLLVIIFISIILVIFSMFTIYNIFNTNIISGVFIKGIDVSKMSPSDAKYKIDNYIVSNLPEEITVKYEDFATTISLSQMDIKFDTKSATNSAFQIGRDGNIFENNFSVLSNLFSNINIEPIVTLDDSLLRKNLEDISSQLPNPVVQSSYYIEGNELIITSGSEGNVVDIDATISSIKNSISTFSCKNSPVEIVVKTGKPDEINVEKIHEEIYKEPIDAYYTKDPFAVFPSENGIDFKISMEEAKELVLAEQKDEYSIPLKISTPNITTNMIGTEAFPDLLSTFSTRYPASNRNRTTNLILAANKVNGTVLMPGETFSYNKTVGARTIAAGYKEAPIYVQGQVVDGIRWRYLPNYFYFV